MLEADSYTYLIKVRRMQVGDSLPVLLPISGKVHMMIERVDMLRKAVHLIVRSSSDKPRNAPAGRAADIILLQWVLKGSKTDTVIRQATEAGVRTILPVIGDFSVAKKQNPAQMDRYRRIIREARQQSGSPVDTIITEPAPLSAVLSTVKTLITPESSVCILCSEAPENHPGMHTLLSDKPAHIVLAIGAEGGISQAELAVLHNADFQPVHFNTNVLRAETAALYAIAAVQTIINEADQWHLPVYTC